MKHGLTKIAAQIICGFRNILIESFISLCIIETVGAIVREYKAWIVLLITQ
jgi:hypothetical protein